MHFRRLLFSIFLAALTGSTARAQQIIPIPDTLSGSVIDLHLASGTRSFFPGFQTQTIAYDGDFLGKTIILKKGEPVTLRVHNQLDEPTTTHWHGLHVAPVNDGGPHSIIEAGAIWSPSFTVLDDAATYWYHPHLHEKTMEHVLKGAAGLIIVRDEQEASLGLPRTYGVDDIPLICQFHTFDPDTRQIRIDDELDNTILVNGTVNGLVNLPAQMVRLRLLNASSHRVFRFGFSNNMTFHQIAGDANLLNAPVAMTRLTLGSGERAEILVNLAGMQGQQLVLRTFGNELPNGFPGGPAMAGMPVGPLDNTTSNVLTIQVQAQTANPVTTMPTVLNQAQAWSTAGADARTLLMTAQPMMSMDNFFINGVKYDHDVINFFTDLGKTEVWTLTNRTMMAHPFHVHGNSFYVLDINGAAPPAHMRGKKDVVMVPPMNTSVRIVTRFENFADPQMPFMYHCHILSHEDHGMMGQFIVRPTVVSTQGHSSEANVRIFPNPVQAGAPLRLDANQPVERFELYDVAGRLVLQLNGHQATVALPNHIAPGLYTVRIMLDGVELIQKLVVSARE